MLSSLYGGLVGAGSLWPTNRGFKARPRFSYYYILKIEIFNRLPLHEEWRWCDNGGHSGLQWHLHVITLHRRVCSRKGVPDIAGQQTFWPFPSKVWLIIALSLSPWRHHPHLFLGRARYLRVSGLWSPLWILCLLKQSNNTQKHTNYPFWSQPSIF
jgi:hypothetical protein